MKVLSSDRGNSLEDDRSLSSHLVSSASASMAAAAAPTPSTSTRTSPPTIHLSPSRQSSSSTDHDPSAANNAPPNNNSGGLCVAKKKRELFSARSSRSGGSNKSSVSDYSRDASSYKPLDSSGSSGQSHSISQSQEDPTNLSTTNNNVTESVKDSVDGGNSGNGTSVSPLPPKRSRFLKRQDCLEKGMDLTTDSTTDIGLPPSSVASQQSTATTPAQGPPPPTIKSSPSSPLMSPYQCLGSPPETKLMSPMPLDAPGLSPPHLSTPQVGVPPPPGAVPLLHPHHAALARQRSQSSPAAPLPYYSLDPVSIPPTQTHRLPAVRVIPDATVADPLAMDQQRLPIPNMSLLCPPEFAERRNQLVKSRSTDSSPPMMRGGVATPTATAPPPPIHPSFAYETVYTSGSSSTTETTSTAAPTSATTTTASSSTSAPTDQFGHCPKARDGPALGCNYCWNTTDANGRILRRKTKYHCPECQANLCIVPCFQQYHEALEREKGVSTSSTASPSQ